MNVPKTIYFYWGNKKISFIRYMAIHSFCKLNPGWRVILIKKRDGTPEGETELTKQNNLIHFTGEDYTRNLNRLDIEVQYLEDDYPLISKLRLSDVHNSDMLAWYILSTKGGVIADTDIVFFKPIEYNKIKDIDIGMISFDNLPLKNYTPVSILIGTPNKFWKVLYDKSYLRMKLKKVNDYECIGTPLIKEFYGIFDDIKKEFKDLNVVKLPSKLIFPFSESHKHCDYAKLTFSDNMFDSLDENCIGIHWYGGVNYSQIYENIITHRNFNRFNNTMSNIIKETYTERVSIVQCVSTALDMMQFATESLINNSGHNNFDYIVVTWNPTEEVKEYLDNLNELYDFVHIVEYKTNPDVGYVPNLRGMMNSGFDYGFKLNNYCGLVNTDMYFGKDWLKNLVKYMSEDTIVNSVHITAFMERPNVITKDLGHTINGQFNHDEFNIMYNQLFKDKLETEDERGGWINTNTMPYLFHKKYWNKCGQWELVLGSPDSPDVRFFRRCHDAGVKYTMSHSSIVYHYQSVERNRPRPEWAKHMKNED